MQHLILWQNQYLPQNKNVISGGNRLHRTHLEKLLERWCQKVASNMEPDGGYRCLVTCKQQSRLPTSHPVSQAAGGPALLLTSYQAPVATVWHCLLPKFDPTNQAPSCGASTCILLAQVHVVQMHGCCGKMMTSNYMYMYINYV